MRNIKPIKVLDGIDKGTVRILHADGVILPVAAHRAEFFIRDDGAKDCRTGARAAVRPTTGKPSPKGQTKPAKPDTMTRAQFVNEVRALLSTPTPAARPQKAQTTMSTKNAAFHATLKAATAEGVFTATEAQALAAVSDKYTVEALQTLIADRRNGASDRAKACAQMDAAMGIRRPGADRPYRQGNEVVFPVKVA